MENNDSIYKLYGYTNKFCDIKHYVYKNSV